MRKCGGSQEVIYGGVEFCEGGLVCGVVEVHRGGLVQYSIRITRHETSLYGKSTPLLHHANHYNNKTLCLIANSQAYSTRLEVQFIEDKL